MPASEYSYCSMCGSRVAPKQRRQLCPKHLSMAKDMDRRIARRAWDLDDSLLYPPSKSSIST